MESVIILSAIIFISILSGTGYYLILKQDSDEFEEKRSAKTAYRTNEEFIKS